MRHYNFHPVVLLRSPAYPFSHVRGISLQGHLDSQYFRNGLFLAAPTLFDELKKARFRADNLKPKATKALWNYLNRLYYRATPFGMFSGFSPVEWQEENVAPQPLILGGRQLHVVSEMKDRPAALPITKESDNAMKLFTNPSLYKAGNELRFLKSEYNYRAHKYEFQVSAIANHALFTFALRYCATPVSLGDLKKSAREKLSVTDRQLLQALSHLVKEHLLLWKQDHTLLHVREAKQVILPGLKLKEHDLTEQIRDSYATLRFKLQEGTITRRQQLKIKYGLKALNAICPDVKPAGLRKFRDAFEQKFEGRAVPLLIALDPELGIGYRDLEHTYHPPQLLESMEFPAKAGSDKQLNWSPMHAVFMKKMQMATDLYQEGILLRDEDLDQNRNGHVRLPPGLSVLFRPLHDQVFIESAGGPTATALFGRFSIFDPYLGDTLRTIADNEVRHNPDVVFAEINCVQDLHAANVEHRVKAYPYELPLITYPSAPAAYVITLSDLWVSTSRGRIVLWSERLKKEVIPRLSSAFNHSRSHLHVYRFLCDLQYQDIKTNFTLDLSHFFPNLDFYPRVSYREAILSLASWHLTIPDIAHQSGDNAPATIRALREYLQQQGLPRYFASYNGDQQLIYDIESDADLMAFQTAIPADGSVSLKEFPFPNDRQPLRDKDGRSYLPQYLTALLRSECIYQGNISGQIAAAALYPASRLTGNWIYFKAYCHPGHSMMIVRAIAALIGDTSECAQLTDRFFYVIYNDPHYHLRLRLRLTNPEKRAGVIVLLETALQRFQNQGWVSAVQIDQYQRELERYGSDRIGLIEDIFDADTKWILDLLADGQADTLSATCSISSVAALLEACSLSLQQKTDHCERVFRSLFAEFSGDRNLQRSLSNKYRIDRDELEKETATAIQAAHASPHYKRLASLLHKLVAASLPPGQIPLQQLITDIVHMHLNRIFTQQPRQQEMVVYFMLYNYYRSLYHRQKDR